MPNYTIYPLLNGKCTIPGNFAFEGGNPSESYPYNLYLWLILGGEKPILVDTGLDNVEEMNQGARHVMHDVITQSADESAGLQLQRHGVGESDVGDVIITHLHFDHVDRLHLFENARIYVSGRGLEKAIQNNWHGSWAPGKTLEILTRTAKDRTVAEDDAEVAPGIRTMWVGGHSPCSQAVLVDTKEGRACITGDTVSLLENIDQDVAVGVHQNLDECYAAMKRIRESAEIVLPSHDPKNLIRFPNGVGR